MVQEEEEQEENYHERVRTRQELATKGFSHHSNISIIILIFHLVFAMKHPRIEGFQGFWRRIAALLVKRFHVARRQISFLLGFFLLPIIIEIILVAALPTPQELQASIAQTGRIKDASVTLLPSIYNPQTIVAYASSNTNTAQTRLTDYIQNSGATLDLLSTDTVMSYVRERYRETAEIFIHKYQMGFAVYPTSTGSNHTMIVDSYFSTVNYHTMATSLSVGSTQLFQYHANSSAKKIITTNQPVITTSSGFSILLQFFEVIYCFDTLPFSLFNFLNSVLAGLFISVLMLPIIQERVSQSKNLQLLTGISKATYWFSHFIFDFCCCFIICVFWIIIIKVENDLIHMIVEHRVSSRFSFVFQIGAAATTNSQSEVYIYRDATAGGYFFFMTLIFSVAVLPMLYVFAFGPKSELIGFVIFFVVNLVACFFDVILDFIALFSQASSTSGQTSLARNMNVVSSILAFLFPTVNLKQSFFNIRVRSNTECISASNSLLYTSYSVTEPWMSTREPGLGVNFIFFVIQAIAFWVILILIENGVTIRLACRRCCRCDKDLYSSPEREPSETSLSAIQVEPSRIDSNQSERPKSTNANRWNDSVRYDRLILFIFFWNFILTNFLSSSILMMMFVVKGDQFSKKIHGIHHQQSWFAILFNVSKNAKKKSSEAKCTPQWII